MGGIAQEIVERLIARGGSPGHIHDASDYVPTITPFDPEIHKALLFELMRESGVELLLHAWFLDALAAEGRVAGAGFATVGGLRQVAAARTIDATADAYVAASAGVPTQQGDARGRVQPASLMFRLSHVDREALAAYVRHNPDQMRTSLKAHERSAESLTAVAGLYELWEAARARGDVTVPRELVSHVRDAVRRRGDGQHDPRGRRRPARPGRPDPGRGRGPRAGDAAGRLLPARRARLRARPARRDRDADRHPRVAPDRGRVHPDRAGRARGAPLRRRGRAQRLPDRHPQPRRERHDHPPPAARRVVRDPVPLPGAARASTTCSSPGAASRPPTRRWPRPG